VQQITVYKVSLTGSVSVQATDATDAKAKALEHFAASPLLYLVIEKIETILVDKPVP
jgi:hypothetical protein